MKMTTDPANSTLTYTKKTVTLRVLEKLRRIDVIRDPNKNPNNETWQVTLDGKPVEASAQLLQPGVLSLILDGQTCRCLLDDSSSDAAVTVNGKHFSYEIHDPRSLAARRQKQRTADGEQIIKAPMPGRIVQVFVQPGQDIAAHQPIVAIEAMKMQNELRSPCAGKVKEIRVKAGQTVVAAEIVAILS